MIDGEYIALGRQTSTTGLALQQFSNQQSQAFNITGSGIQEQELTDGFRMSIRSSQPMTINTNVVNGIATTMLAGLAPGTNSINNFRYLVTTNLAGVLPNINRMVAVVQVPINPVRLQTIATQMGANANSNIRLSIAQRGVLINPGGATANSGTNLNRKLRDSNSNSTNTNNSGGNSGGNSDGNSANNSASNSASNSGVKTSLTSTLSSTSPLIFSSQTTPFNSDSSMSSTNSGINGNGPAATQLLLAPTFTPIAANAVLDQINGRLAIPVSQLDGEYIITVQMANDTSGTGAGTSLTQGEEPETAGITTSAANSIPGQQPAFAGTPGTASTVGVPPQPAGTINGTTGVIKRQLIPAGVLASQVASPAPKATSTIPQIVSPASTTVTPQPTTPQVALPQVTSLTVPAPTPTTALASVPTPATQQPAPTTAGIPNDNGGVIISMAWINMMAQVAQQFLPVDVDQLMGQLAAQQGQTVPHSTTQGTVGDIGAGLLAMHWVG